MHSVFCSEIRVFIIAVSEGQDSGERERKRDAVYPERLKPPPSGHCSGIVGTAYVTERDNHSKMADVTDLPRLRASCCRSPRRRSRGSPAAAPSGTRACRSPRACRSRTSRAGRSEWCRVTPPRPGSRARRARRARAGGSRARRARRSRALR